MTRAVALLGLLLACTSSRVAETHAKSEATVTEVVHARVETQEDRGPVTTVVEEFEIPRDETVGFVPAAPREQPQDSSAGNARATPVLTRRTTITQAPIVTHTVATASERERAEVKAEVQTKVADKSKPTLPEVPIGCQFGTSFVLIVVLACAAAAFAIFRRLHAT